MARTTHRKRILWTADELKLLKTLAGKESVHKISRQLKRSEAAIRFKAWQKRITLAAKKSEAPAPKTGKKTAVKTAVKTAAKKTAAKKTVAKKAAKKSKK